MNKPRVFISSTIYDFEDMRSALKYWFDELGYDVQMSEYSDFNKNAASNSYDACIDVISQCDYFILLIGARVGGMYDEHTSITRKEYQAAYDLALQGKIKKIITFVRQNVWDVLEDRKSLKHILKELTILENDFPLDKNSIIYHDSKLVKHAEHIQSFLDEVTRKAEFRQGNKPVFNWVNSFRDFSDIINVIKIEMSIKSNVSQSLMEHNVKMALVHNLRELTWNRDETTITAPYLTFKHIHKKLALNANVSDFMTRQISLTKAEVDMASPFFLFCRNGIKELTISVFEQAISSGLFIKYDKFNECFTSTVFATALQDMVYEISRLKKFNDEFSDEQHNRIVEYIRKLNRNSTSEYNFSLIDLTMFSALYERQRNIYTLSKFMVNYINTHDESLAYPNLPNGFVESPKPTVDVVLSILEG